MQKFFKAKKEIGPPRRILIIPTPEKPVPKSVSKSREKAHSRRYIWTKQNSEKSSQVSSGPPRQTTTRFPRTISTPHSAVPTSQTRRKMRSQHILRARELTFTRKRIPQAIPMTWTTTMTISKATMILTGRTSTPKRKRSRPKSTMTIFPPR